MCDGQSDVPRGREWYLRGWSCYPSSSFSCSSSSAKAPLLAAQDEASHPNVLDVAAASVRFAAIQRLLWCRLRQLRYRLQRQGALLSTMKRMMNGLQPSSRASRLCLEQPVQKRSDFLLPRPSVQHFVLPMSSRHVDTHLGMMKDEDEGEGFVVVREGLEVGSNSQPGSAGRLSLSVQLRFELETVVSSSDPTQHVTPFEPAASFSCGGGSSFIVVKEKRNIVTR